MQRGHDARARAGCSRLRRARERRDVDRHAPAGRALATVAIADATLLGLIVLLATRGADRLTPATLGIRRTRFWPAVGWALAIAVGVSAFEGLWTVIIGGGGEQAAQEGFGTVSDGEIVWLVLALAVITPIAEELAFRGYLFPALTRWRGIIAVLAILIPIAGVILGIVALVLGSSTRSDIGPGGAGYTQAKAGFILGIVAVAGSIVMWIASVAILTS